MLGEHSIFVRLIRLFSPRVGSDDAARTTVHSSFCPTVIRGPLFRLGRKSTLRGLEALTLVLNASYVCKRDACDRDPCCSSQAERNDSSTALSRRPVRPIIGKRFENKPWKCLSRLTRIASSAPFIRRIGDEDNFWSSLKLFCKPLVGTCG